MLRRVAKWMRIGGPAAMLAVTSYMTLGTAEACTPTKGPNLQAATSPGLTAMVKQGLFGRRGFQPRAKVGVKPQAQVQTNYTIAGLWQTTFTSQGMVVDQAWDVWHNDGTEIMVDTSAPAADNVCVGYWEQTDPLTFKLVHPSWTFDANGNLNGAAIFHETVQLDATANTYTGTFSVDLYDADGNQLDHLEGEISATRFLVE